MKKFISKFSFVLICSISLLSCDKPSDETPTGKTVYIAANEHTMLTRQGEIWRNGTLSDRDIFLNVELKSMYVSGRDVYVIGRNFNEDYSGGWKYWKNGKAFSLENPGSIIEATGISVSNQDVYVSGEDITYSGTGHFIKQAVYWKNGHEVVLTDGTKDARATSVFVSGNDVYVAGQEGNIAKYWKNGTPISLPDTANYSCALSIFVAGTDVFVAGWVNIVGHEFAVYWKNGIPFHLTDGNFVACANSVYVSNGDVYVAGYECNNLNSSVAKYWKNGKPVVLGSESEQPDYRSFANSIFVTGSEVYVAGFQDTQQCAFTTYWNNDTAIFLTDQKLEKMTWSEACAIIVK
jgi:hypothetical protein